MDLIKSLISFYITFRGMSVLRSWILLSHRWRSTPIKSHQLILKIFKTFTHHLHQVINPFLYPTNPLDLNSNINPRPWKASYLLQIQSKSLILLIRSQSWIKNHKTIHFIGQKVYLLFNFNLFKELAGQHSFSISLSLSSHFNHIPHLILNRFYLFFFSLNDLIAPLEPIFKDSNLISELRDHQHELATPYGSLHALHTLDQPHRSDELDDPLSHLHDSRPTKRLRLSEPHSSSDLRSRTSNPSSLLPSNSSPILVSTLPSSTHLDPSLLVSSTHLFFLNNNNKKSSSKTLACLQLF